MPAENYVLLETIALTQSAASVTFDNLPTSGYTDLKVVHSARMSNTDSPVLLNFNGVTTGYSWRRLYGNGSSASSQSGSDGYFLHGNTSSMTANTFSNSEFYIPNYRSNQAKSISAESALETNATAGELFMHAVLWNNTAAITSFTMTPLTGSFVANSTFSLYGIAAFGTTPTLAPKATGGNIVANDGTFWYHAFLSNGTFTPQVGLSCDVLVVAGGGGGGSGGGGAGGLTAFTSQSLSNATNYTCTVGAGGTGAFGFTEASLGGDSRFGALTLIKGGGWGGITGATPTTGGSGGGAPANQTNFGLGTSGQGNNGGPGLATGASPFPAGAGGGAGAAGNTPVNSSSHGNGGAGVNTYSSWLSATALGVSGFIAGGGGGGYSSGTAGTGGSGGGGGGGSGTTGANAIVNTGGGGGGGFINSSSQNGGRGGSGIVIIRYPIA